MPPAPPPLAALFLTYFDDLRGQEVIYYRSLSDALPPNFIEHTALPSGLHTLGEDIVVFSHHGLPGVGLFRSRNVEGEGRGRRMGTLGLVLAPPATADQVFDLHAPLQDFYDRLEGLENPFADPRGDEQDSNQEAKEDAAARTALLDTVWEQHHARLLEAPVVPSATTVAESLAAGTSPNHPVTYMPCLLNLLGPMIVTVYKASLSGKRILIYGNPPFLPLAAFGWLIWAMGLPPASALRAGARPSTWLGNIGLMNLDDIKKRSTGWIATTSDVVYKSHLDTYDVFLDFSESMPTDGTDVREWPPRALPSPRITGVTRPESGKATTTTLSYLFYDLALYRSLVYLDESPRTVESRTLGFRASSRTGGLWLMMFELLERMWNLCVGVCEFALGRGNVGSRGIQLHDDDDSQALLHADGHLDVDEDEEEDDYDEAQFGDATDVPDDKARRGRLILGQFHHNAYHLYARLLGVAAGRWELSDSDLRNLTGESRVTWAGRTSTESQFWLSLARVWNVEPVAEGGDSTGTRETEGQ